jgi:hypothetical protein
MTVAPGAFVFTDSIPFSIAEVVEYVDLGVVVREPVSDGGVLAERLAVIGENDDEYPVVEATLPQRGEGGGPLGRRGTRSHRRIARSDARARAS